MGPVFRPGVLGSRGAVELLLAIALCLPAGSAEAQDSSGTRGIAASSAGTSGWNDSRVLDLVDLARAARRTQSVDTAMSSYSARADGYVYFYLDRPESNDRTLVKTDQLALQVYWQAPRRTGQHIVGQRDEKSLPTNINYHLDHLTVVQDDFGDVIRLGDGDEVEAVRHPMSPGSQHVYDFRLADSLSIAFGETEEVRVYEVLVRPKTPSEPGFVGSVFIDRGTAAIVRMSFTFTPASYVDPYLDYIRIALDNSLWMGRYWLPYRQEIELRRELPVLDFLAGSVIRGRWRVGDYDFAAGFPEDLFRGRRITAASSADRASFAFDRGLFDDLEEAGLEPSRSVAEVESRARELIAENALSGLQPVRLYLGSASELARHSRAEGYFAGAGVTLRPRGDALLRAFGGYATAREKWAGSFVLSGGPGPYTPELDAYWDRPRDIGGIPAASYLVATLASSTGVGDYTDPWFTRGATVTIRREGSAAGLRLRWEDHRSANDVVSEAPGIDRRAVRGVTEGILGAVEAVVPFRLPAGGAGQVEGTLARLGDNSFRVVRGQARWGAQDRSTGRGWSLGARAGWASAGAPSQALFLLGGRGSLPGHALRSFEGDRFWLADAEVTVPLAAPWLSVRLFGAVGATALGDARPLSPHWTGTDSNGIRASVGAGLALGWDVLRLDLARGVRDGRWELAFSISPTFAGWM